MDKEINRFESNPSDVLASKKIISDSVDDIVYTFGGRYNIDGIFQSIKTQIQLHEQNPNNPIGFNRKDLAILGYTLYQVNPRKYSIFKNMDFFVNQHDVQFMFFSKSDIHVVKPISNNRSFILSDCPITSFSPNGGISSIQKIQYDANSIFVGIVAMVDNADYYFLLPVHPKYLIVYHFSVEMNNRKDYRRIIQVEYFSDDIMTKYNCDMFSQCYNKIIGKENELEKITEYWCKK